MKRKVSVISMLLALLMILGACGGANDKPCLLYTSDAADEL